MLTIKILGADCENGEKLEQVARQAIDNFRMPAEVIAVTDWDEIHKYPILATPALVINEKVVSSGRIPRQNEVITWLADAAMEEYG
jgi:small redox-active disulfide protein 2